MSGTQVATWVGRELSGGRYRVDAQLGEGGMGTVFRAWDKNLSREVVIKVPHAAMLQDAEFAARFAREISSLVKLSHPHIVKISDVGDHDRLPFAVMQFLPGGSLEDRQKSDSAADVKPLPPESLKSWLVSIADALDFVHSQGYIHRDVKPANILFDAHGHAYLSDFGIAKSAESGAAASSKTLTGSGMVIGTPEYMAPELIMGQTCDGRVDQYALVVTVFEILAGRRPFEDATSTAVLVQHSTKEPPDLASLSPDVPAGLAVAIRKGLSKSPNDRFANCRKFADAVLAAVTSVSISVESKATCPVCQKVLKLSDKLRGKEVPCPGCKSMLRVSDDLRHLTELKPDKNSNTGGAGTRVVGVRGAMPEVAQDSDGTFRLADDRGEAAVSTQSEPATSSAPVTQETMATGQPSSRTKPTQSPASKKKEQTVKSKTSHVPKPQAVEQEPPAGNKKWLSIAAGGAAIVLLLGITIFVLTGRGTVKITVKGGDDSIQVKVDGDEITITGLDESLKLSAGEHGLTVTSPRFETVTKSFKVTRGDTTVVEVELRPLSPMANTPERQTVAGVEAVPVAASEPLAKKEQVRPVAVKFDLPPIEAMKRPIDADAIATAKVDEGIRQLKSRARVAAVKEFEEALKIDPGIAFKEIPSLNDGQIIAIRAALYDDDKGQSKQSKALELYREGMATSEKANYSHAIIGYKAAADFDPAFAWSANNLAWLLATCPDRNVRDGKLAVEYAFKACRASSWSYWSFQNTLAAALAEASAYEQAVAVQKLAKENYSSIRGSEEDFGHEEWQLNLARFEQGQRPDYPASWAKKVAAAAFKIQLDRNQAIYQRTTLKLGGSLIEVPDALQRSLVAEVDFGDGGAAEPVELAPDLTFQLEHVYPTPGEFPVIVVVSDSKTDPVKATATVTVKALAPVPDAAALDKSRKTIHDIFKKEFADANKTAARIAWSEKLIEQGQQTADDPAGRYVLFDEAALQAVEAPEPNLAFRAIGEMAKTFDINQHAKKAELLTLAVEKTKFTSFHKKSAETGLVAFEDALQNDEFAAASDLLKATQKAAEAGKELGLLKKVTTASERLALRKAEWEQFVKAQENLTIKPDDPESNQAVGNYLCFTKGMWSRGVFFLSKSSNPTVSSLASIELERKKSDDTKLKIADGWFSLAEESDEGIRPQIKARACYWYRAVVPNLSGLSQQRVDQLLRTHDPDFRSVSRKWKVVQQIDGESGYDLVYGIALSPDGKLFAAGDPSHGMRLWDVDTGKMRREFRNRSSAATEQVNPVFLKDGKRFLFVSTRHHLVEIYGVDKDKSLTAFPNDPNTKFTSMAAINSNEDLLVTAGENGIVTLWSVSTAKPIRRIEHGLPGWPFVAFCADGKRVACGSPDSNVVSICDSSTGQRVGTLSGHSGNVIAIAVGRDGKFMATTGRDGTIRIWSASSDKQLRQIAVEKAGIKCLAMSPDERLIAAGLDDGSVMIWDSETGRQLDVLKSNLTHMHLVTFSLNGRRLAASGDRAKHRIWQAE